MNVAFFLMHPYSKRLTQSLATTVRVEELASRLVEKGVKVYVFTPYDSDFRTAEGINIVQIKGLLGGVPLNLDLRVSLYNLTRMIYHTKHTHKQILKLLKKVELIEKNPIAKNVLKLCKKYKIDILHAIQDNAALMLLGIKQNLNIPLLLDLTGVWLEEAVANDLITPYSPEYYTLKTIETRILESVDVITVIGEEMRRYIVSEFHVPENKVRIVLQGAKLFSERVKNRNIIERCKVVYSGILSHRKNVNLLIDSIPYVLAKNPQTLFLITEKGDLLSYFKRRTKHINNINFFFFSERDKLMSFLQNCDIGLITNVPSMANRIDMPSKLFEYMAVGLPVVTNETGGWTDIVKKNNIGVVTANNPKDFAEGINFLIENPEERIRMGKRSLQLIKEVYNWDKSAEDLYNLYLELSQ
jgi:glycosyltransferase involved in cell wall biosynthesis